MNKIKEDCIFLIKTSRNGRECRACSELICKRDACDFYKTEDDIKLEQRVSKLKEEANNDAAFCQKCETGCCFFISEEPKCCALKALFCAEEKCSFYRQNGVNGELIRWKRTKNTLKK